MNTGKIYGLLILALLSFEAGGQLTLTNKAAKLCQDKDYQAALETIGRALGSDEENNHPYAWYVQGFIHKEIYKETETGKRSSSHRPDAVAAFEKSISLDVQGEYREMTRSALRFLATTYLNDALLMTREITEESDTEPEKTFAEFKRIMVQVDPNTNFDSYQKEIYRKLAQAHYAMWENDVRRPLHAEKAIGYYVSALAIDSLDCESNYNMAILRYNNGVHMIRSIDGSTDIMELIMIQDESVGLFRQALPYAEAAFLNCPAKLDYYKAMMFINRALGNEDLYDEYKAKSESLIRSGQLKN